MVQEVKSTPNNAGYSLRKSSDSAYHIEILKNGKLTRGMRIPDDWLELKITKVEMGGFANGLAPLSMTANKGNGYALMYPAGVTKSGTFVAPNVMDSIDLDRLAPLIYNDPSKLANINLDNELQVIQKDMSLIQILCDIAGHGYEAKLDAFKERFASGARSLLPDAAQEYAIQKETEKLAKEYKEVCGAFCALNGVKNPHQEYEMIDE